MSIQNPVSSVVENLREKGDVTSVYGEPIVTGDRTTIPVARVAYGFGGGYGTSTGDDETVEFDAEGELTEEGRGGGEGGGMGGGIVVTPVGVVEISSTGTRFVRFSDRRRLVGTLVVGALIGLLLGRRGRN